MGYLQDKVFNPIAKASGYPQGMKDATQPMSNTTVPLPANGKPTSAQNQAWYTPHVSAGVNEALNRMPKMPNYVDKKGNIDERFMANNPQNIKGDIEDIYHGKDGKVLDRTLMSDPTNIKTGDRYAKGVSMLDQLTGTANSKGPTSHANALFDQQRLSEKGLRDQADTSSKQASQETLDMLATQGGFDSGARERAMRNAAKDRMYSRQGVARQGATDRLGIRAGDEKYKQDLKGNLVNANLSYDTYKTGLDSQNVRNDMVQDEFNSRQNMSVLDRMADATVYDKDNDVKANQFNALQYKDVSQMDAQNDMFPWTMQTQAVAGQDVANQMNSGGGGNGGKGMFSGKYGLPEVNWGDASKVNPVGWAPWATEKYGGVKL